jgi:hypothetical protein
VSSGFTQTGLRDGSDQTNSSSYTINRAAQSFGVSATRSRREPPLDLSAATEVVGNLRDASPGLVTKLDIVVSVGLEVLFDKRNRAGGKALAFQCSVKRLVQAVG